MQASACIFKLLYPLLTKKKKEVYFIFLTERIYEQATGVTILHA